MFRLIMSFAFTAMIALNVFFVLTVHNSVTIFNILAAGICFFSLVSINSIDRY